MGKDNLELVGIGNAIVDVLSKTVDNFLTENKIHKGTMTLIEADAAETLYAKMGPCTEMSGGSAANTIAAFAAMGGNAGFIGKVANDQMGKVFRHDLQASGVSFDTPALEDGPPTARCLIMITPDAQRTMCTHLGASVWVAPSDLNEEMIKNAQVTYLEGYLFDRPRAKQAFHRAGEIAHAAGKKVALSLSDPFCVKRHRAEFLELVQNHVDIVFANEEEIFALFDTRDFDVAAHHARDNCEIAVLTRSAKGSTVITEKETFEIKAEPIVRVVDTTGAGDMYAAGFLYGYTHGKSLAECGKIASVSAAEVLGHIGARPQVDLKQMLSDKKAI